METTAESLLAEYRGRKERIRELLRQTDAEEERADLCARRLLDSWLKAQKWLTGRFMSGGVYLQRVEMKGDGGDAVLGFVRREWACNNDRWVGDGVLLACDDSGTVRLYTNTEDIVALRDFTVKYELDVTWSELRQRVHDAEEAVRRAEEALRVVRELAARVEGHEMELPPTAHYESEVLP